MDKFKAIHAVVNSAGISHAQLLVSSKGVLDSKMLIKVFMINVVGTVNVCKYAA